MVDVFNVQKRSQIMASISAKDTTPELLVRKSLHRKGLRYRLHSRNLPGTPDLAFRQFNAVVFINGCFWHGHDCHLFRMPSSNQEYWQNKFETNRARDARNKQLLSELNWRVLIVWECSIKGKHRLDFETLIADIENWLRGESGYLEIRGLAESDAE